MVSVLCPYFTSAAIHNFDYSIYLSSCRQRDGGGEEDFRDGDHPGGTGRNLGSELQIQDDLSGVLEAADGDFKKFRRKKFRRWR